MLTGDKGETAKKVAVGAGLIQEGAEVVRIGGGPMYEQLNKLSISMGC